MDRARLSSDEWDFLTTWLDETQRRMAACRPDEEYVAECEQMLLTLALSTMPPSAQAG